MRPRPASTAARIPASSAGGAPAARVANTTGTSPRSASGAPTTQQAATPGSAAALHQRWRDVLAATDDHVLDAPGDGQIAVGVEAAHVAGAQPPVRHAGLALRAQVAQHQAVALDADLALAASWRALPSGWRRTTRWPASTVPTVPTRRAPGGFMVEVQVASDRP